ncbi:MAG: hypothetical protein JWO13_679 [Acidobacteriales bacterium]|nr:hypothetical protein [Terriglobales bacterium]
MNLYAMHRTRDKGLLLIASMKLLKGISLLAIGVGAIGLLHKDVEAVVFYWIDILGIDFDNRFFGHIIAKAMNVDDHQLRVISIATFFYSVVLLTEGVGLFMGLRWAEYLTIFATASFIPFEIYEIAVHFSAGKVLLFLVNVAVVGYLVYVVRKKEAHFAAGHS